MAKKNPEWMVYGAGFVDVTLSRPASFNGVEQSKVRMREPTVGDLEAGHEAKGNDASREISILANLCEVSPDDMRKLPYRDYVRLQTAYTGFID